MPGQRSFGYEAHGYECRLPTRGDGRDDCGQRGRQPSPMGERRNVWTDLAKMLDFNPQMSELDTPMADQGAVSARLR